MEHRSRSVFFILFFIALTATAEDKRETIGAVDRVQASAHAVYQENQRVLANGEPVYFEDKLQTGPDARLAVTLNDGTELTLGENGSLLIDAFVYEPDGGKGEMALQVVQGAFLFVGGKIENAKDAKVDIKTSVGTLGIRGTTVWGGAIDGAFGVLALAGIVTVENAAGAVTLNAGDGTMIDATGSAPSVPASWSEEKTARAVATISFSGE